MPIPRHCVFAILIVTLLLTTPLSAHAHRANIFAWAEGETIHTECSFSGGKPAMGAAVQVMDQATGTLLTEGHTDKKGLYSFAIPIKAHDQRMDLKLVLVAGEGHRGEWVITAEEYLGEADSEESAPTTQATASATTAPVSTGGAMQAISLDEATLKRIVDEAISRRIAPLNHKLAAMAEPGPKVSDIFGGIGYILGLFGIAAYFKSKGRR